MKTAAVLACAILMGGATYANATVLSDPLSRCTSANCESARVDGVVLLNRAGARPDDLVPWVAQIFARAGECMRIEVLNQFDGDLHMSLISPSGGNFWRDENSGQFCTECPVIKVRPAPVEGWYTLHVSPSFNPRNSRFTLSYGRYNRSNFNCAIPTEPVF